MSPIPTLLFSSEILLCFRKYDQVGSVLGNHIFSETEKQNKTGSGTIVSHLPGGHLPPPKFGHLPPPNSDISHPPKKNICQEDNCHPQFFFFFFWRTFLGFFDLQLMEDIKDGKEEVLDEVVMEHIK